MDPTSVLRVDWYSCLLGTQIAAISGLLTPAAPFRIYRRPQLAREYLHPAIHNGGNTIFYYRIKEPGNLVTFGMKSLVKIFERNIVGGFVYHLMENSRDAGAGLMTAFSEGGFLGICFSLRNNFRIGFWDAVLCGISSGQVAGCGEQIKHLMLSTSEVIADDFKVPIPYSPASFWNGALTGCALSLYFADVSDYTDFILYPEFEDNATNMDIFGGYAFLVQDIILCLAKCGFFFTEKLIVGGVLYCLMEMALREVTNLERQSVIVPLCGSALGLYCGAKLAPISVFPMKKIRKAVALSLIISSCNHISLMVMQKYLTATGKQ